MFVMRFAVWLPAALLLLFGGNSCDGRTADGDLEQLVNFILDREKDRHKDFQLAVNETVRVAVDGLLDRLRCVQQGLTHLQCVQCLRPETILSMLGPDSVSPLTNHLDLEHVSVLLLNHALTFRYVCRNQPKDGKLTRCTTYTACRNQLRTRLPMENPAGKPMKLLEDIETVLREIKAFYEPLPGQKCFSAETILTEMPPDGTAEQFHLEELTTLLVAHLLNGECIDVGEAVTDFLEDIFLHYGDRCNKIITELGFEKLMNDLRTQDRDDHEDHDMPVSSCLSSSDNKLTTQKGHIITMTEVGGVPKEQLDQSVYSTKEVNKRTTRGTTGSSTHKHKSLASECLSANRLLRKFALVPSQTISPVEFVQLCPALVQQVASGVCNYATNDSVVVKITRPSNLEIYGYGTLAVFVISMSSLCGIFLFPILAKNYYKFIMMGFVGLSFGTMVGDALLHLVPQALGLHSHDEGDENEDHEALSLDNVPSYLWRQLGVMLVIYVLFFFEALTNMLSGGDSHGEHGHSHVPDKLPETLNMKRINNSQQISGKSNQRSDAAISEKAEPVIESVKIFCGLTTMSAVIIIGDTLHNFGDGLAIGASFAPGLKGGLSTSLAVFCHELPHEFGDFVVLLSTGLSFGKALLVNFISALFSFVGLYIGIQLGEDLTTRKWILSATAGIFLYVALTEMLPELKSNKSGSSWKMFLVKNIGILSGALIMIMIAVYEDHFHI